MAGCSCYSEPMSAISAQPAILPVSLISQDSTLKLCLQLHNLTNPDSCFRSFRCSVSSIITYFPLLKRICFFTLLDRTSISLCSIDNKRVRHRFCRKSCQIQSAHLCAAKLAIFLQDFGLSPKFRSSESTQMLLILSASRRCSSKVGTR